MIPVHKETFKMVKTKDKVDPGDITRLVAFASEFELIKSYSFINSIYY